MPLNKRLKLNENVSGSQNSENLQELKNEIISYFFNLDFLLIDASSVDGPIESFSCHTKY